jgi:hypothetical protein
LGKAHLDSGEVAHFASQLALEVGKDDRQATIDHLLRVVDLTPDQLLLIARSESVANVVGLQHSIVRYARSKQFEAARQSAVEEPAWKYALTLLALAFPPI